MSVGGPNDSNSERPADANTPDEPGVAGHGQAGPLAEFSNDLVLDDEELALILAMGMC